MGLLQVVLFVASTAWQISKQNKMKRKQEAEREKRRGIETSVSGEVVNLPVVYGTALVAGIRTYHKVTSSIINAVYPTSISGPIDRLPYTYSVSGATYYWKTWTDGSTYTLDILWNGVGIYSKVETSYSEGSLLLECNRIEIGSYVYDRGDQITNKGSRADGYFQVCRYGAETAKYMAANNIGTYSGSKNEFLFVQQALCHAPISKVHNIRVDGKPYNDPSLLYGQKIHIYYDGNVRDPLVYANDPSRVNNFFPNVAYASSVFRLNRDEQNYGGVPDVAFYIDGLKIYDITGPNTVASTKTYSKNPALVLFDYLTNTIYGRGLPYSKIDIPSFYYAKQICDTIVMPAAKFGGKVHGGIDVQLPVRLYEANLVLDTSATIRDNINLILETMNQADLVWSGGKFKLKLEYPTSAAAEDALVDASHFFTEDDIIRQSVTRNYPNAQERYNQVTVRFQNESENFKDDSITWPKTFSPVHSTYLSEDNGQPMKTEISTPGITNPYIAQAKAEYMVRFSRSVFHIELTLNKKALTLEPGDYFKLSSPNLGINNENFIAEEVEVQSDLTVKVKAVKADYNVLAWNVANDIAYNRQPPAISGIAPVTGLAFNNTGMDLSISSGKLTWTGSVSSTYEYLIYYSINGGTSWSYLGSTKSDFYDIQPLETNVYDFSVIARSTSGSLSSREIVAGITIQRISPDKIAVIYADNGNEAINNQSYTAGSYEFVAYYTYNGATPTLPIRTGIVFNRFIGTPAILNYASSKNWDLTGSNTNAAGINGFTFNVFGDANSRVMGTDPYQAPGIVWKVTGSDVAADDDGGFIVNFTGIDPNKQYISFVYFRKTSISSSGIFSHGCLAGNARLLNGTPATFAHFSASVPLSNFVKDRWYVAVGILHAANETTPVDSGLSGIYDTTTNTKIFSGTDYWMDVGTTQRLNAYVRQNTDPTTSYEFWGPGFYERNGDEPSFNKIIFSGGVRTPGWWNIDIVAAPAKGLSSATVTSYFVANTGFSPRFDDVAILNTTDSSGTTAYIYSSNGWLEQAELINGNLIVSKSITSGALATKAVTTRNINIDENLVLGSATSGFSMGKASPADFDNSGIYMGRTLETDGSTGFGVLMGNKDLSGKDQFLLLTKSDGFNLVNANFKLLNQLAIGSATWVTSSSTVTLSPTIDKLSLTIVGGGGGGDANQHNHTAGTNTVVQLWDGASYTGISWTAGYGTAGSIVGGTGGSTPYGIGGSNGTVTTRYAGRDSSTPITTIISPTNGTGYGAGGGSFGAYFKAGAAGKVIAINDIDLTSYTAPKLVITIGTGGSGATSSLGAAYNAGNGSPGLVIYQGFTGTLVEAGVVPFQVTAQGTFTKTAGVTSNTLVPNLVKGLWLFYEAGAATNLDMTVRVDSTGKTVYSNSNFLCCVCEERPTITGNSTTRTVAWRYYQMDI